jgi:hypothetical protein
MESRAAAMGHVSIVTRSAMAMGSSDVISNFSM